MKRWRSQLGRIASILILAAIGLLVGGYIFANQNVSFPSWTPGVGKETYRLDARFTTAAGVMPGQGQAVTIAGVSVGKVAGVRLDRGQAVVEMDLEEKYGARVRPDATVLLRPKTPLKDMIVELDPGTATAGAPLKEGSVLSVEASEPTVDFDQVIAALDGDTRAQLASLLGNAGTSLGGAGGRALARALRRFEPLSRSAAEATRLLAKRGTATRRLVSNVAQITGELGSTDAQLAEFVKQNDALFSRFANQNENLAETVRRLPDTLSATSDALRKAGRLSATLETALPKVRPATRGLAGSLREVRPFLEKTRPVLEKQLRPFARDAQPVARRLAPGVKLTADATPGLGRFTTVLNHLFDAMAYDPPGDGVGKQSYLFYLPWAGHNTNSALSTQDAVGPMRRSVVLLTCGGQALLDNYTRPDGRADSPFLKTLIDLLNPPQLADNTCPKGDQTK
jgi:phospholipid/cholesterol/gamma-HCH transport system substrate-binding protein